jgi:hypothetical protein
VQLLAKSNLERNRGRRLFDSSRTFELLSGLDHKKSSNTGNIKIEFERKKHDFQLIHFSFTKELFLFDTSSCLTRKTTSWLSISFELLLYSLSLSFPLSLIRLFEMMKLFFDFDSWDESCSWDRKLIFFSRDLVFLSWLLKSKSEVFWQRNQSEKSSWFLYLENLFFFMFEGGSPFDRLNCSCR